ncbi:Hypothetical protein FKW44_000571 [Caligus rogercresseyi]|uniref:Uncharacterized protein n=1 Tax=Caligus rogercresseyi TaxID=217165 RepID=A0A7T8KHK7_CALRO|nr:Hypothetical protein FKW44_000571 [Caligus rogercresseyi]
MSFRLTQYRLMGRHVPRESLSVFNILPNAPPFSKAKKPLSATFDLMNLARDPFHVLSAQKTFGISENTKCMPLNTAALRLHQSSPHKLVP